VPGGVSVSIHVHGGDIGSISRSVYALDGTASRFVSHYKNAIMPNFRGDDTVANKVKFDRAAG
jgi:predicted metal-dependent enzyme (double-stranded beta helix superfamily)